jgi:hypothetical protein
LVIALAGRRVDSAETKDPRFPASNVDAVKRRIRAVLKEKAATTLVSSAACGADLIALSEAGRVGLRRRVILPFERRYFRETSVTDRSGGWGPVYDQILDEVEAAGDLVVLQNRSDDEPYSAANRAILDEALALAKALHQPVAAVLIWNGISRHDHDLTEEFRVEALKRGLETTEILTT